MEKKILSIGETAKFIGVSISNLRNWDKNGVLPSFRPSPTSKRYYRCEDIENFLKKPKKIDEEDPPAMARAWVIASSPIPISSSFYCETNDVFSARLQSFSMQLERLPELKKIFPLIIAVTGEIGNNSYNHNIGNWPDVPGIFFAYDLNKRQIFLADRGRGILKTLERVVPKLKTHSEALKIAFTQYISGRAPEDRGNGLKFVKDVVLANPFRLQFYSGNAELEIKHGAAELNVKTTNLQFRGCVAILTY